MDPNANLLEALRIVQRLISVGEGREYYADRSALAADAHRLADLVEALDGWISGGGFLPERWQRGPAGGARSLGIVRAYVARTAHAHEDDNTFARGEWMEILAARQLLEAVGGCSCGATGCERCDPAMAPPVWAAYSGTATGDGISLHKTEREALEAVATGLGMDFRDFTDAADEGAGGRGALAEFDDAELRDEIDDYCSTRADDWSVQEVTLP